MHELNLFWPPTTQTLIVIVKRNSRFYLYLWKAVQFVTYGHACSNPFLLLLCYTLEQSRSLCKLQTSPSVFRSQQSFPVSLCPPSSHLPTAWIGGATQLLLFSSFLPPLTYCPVLPVLYYKSPGRSRPRQDFQQQVRDKIILGVREGVAEEGWEQSITSFLFFCLFVVLGIKPGSHTH